MDSPGATIDGGARGGRRSTGLWAILVLVGLAVGCQTGPETADEESDTLVGRPVDPVAPTAAPPPARPDRETREGALWYRIDLAPGRLTVTVRLLKPAEVTTFFLPDQSTRPPISIGGAAGPDGPVAINQIPSEDRIDVESSDLPWVELTYRVDLPSRPAEAPRPTSSWEARTLLAYAPAILVVPSKQVLAPIRDIPIEIHAPQSWRLLATWSPIRSAPSKADDRRAVHGYLARDVQQLRDAFLVAGARLGVEAGSTGSGRLQVGFGDGFDEGRRRLTAMIADITETYRKTFGAIDEIIAYVAPRGREESDRLRGTAKRGGFVVRARPGAPADKETALLVAHEALHLWNGHRLVPDPEAESSTRWFKEGVTHYLAVKTLYRRGIFDFTDVRRQLAKSAFFYGQNPAVRGRRATRLDLHRLPYDRGLLLAVALDGAIAECTGGERSLETWLKGLLDGADGPYGPDLLRESFVATTGPGCRVGRRLWRRHVDAARPVAPKEMFGRLGLHYLLADSLEETKVLPLRGEDRIWRHLFSPRSPRTEPRRTTPEPPTEQETNR